jgi:hypothetical protein
MSFNKKVKRVIAAEDMTLEKAYSDPHTMCPLVKIIGSIKNEALLTFQLDMTQPILSETLWNGKYIKGDPMTKCSSAI